MAFVTAAPAASQTLASWTRVVGDPAHTVLRIQNTGAAVVEVEWAALNGRTVFANIAEIQDEIDAIPPEADGSEPTQIFRFVTGNRLHGLPITLAFQWLLTPALFFNSSGVALCGEASEQINMLATNRGYQGREWGLVGHVVAEVRVAGRWQMYDGDYGVYFLNRQGQIASVAELTSDPSLITNPELRLDTPGPWNPYQLAYANLFSTADNFIRRVAPRATLPPRPLSVELPRGASLRFPGRFATPPADYTGVAPIEDYTNLLLRLPAGSEGPISNPFMLHTIRGTGTVQIGAQTFAIGSPALQDLLDARVDPLEEMMLLEAASAVDVVYLVNPKRWMLETTNTLELFVSARSPLTVTQHAAGDPAGNSDADGVADDGDASGVVGDAPCDDGQAVACDDNCVAAANPGQLDADGDGAGNACDADFDQDELVTDADLAVLQACTSGGSPTGDPTCSESDLNEDGNVDILDRVAFDSLRGVIAPSVGCGIGPELAPALLLLGWLRRRGLRARR